MNVDLQRLRRFAPIVVAVVIIGGGWMLLVAPAVSRSSRAGRQDSDLRQRITQIRASVSGPAPRAVADSPASSFERQVAAGDASSAVLEQLAALASGARATNLLIETGERVVITGPTGPQVAGSVQTDPRFGLFDMPLAYSPVSMAFDAEFANVGALLWRMRDLATTVEIRGVEIKPVGGDARKVHVALSLFAYARQRAAGQALLGAPKPRSGEGGSGVPGGSDRVGPTGTGALP